MDRRKLSPTVTCLFLLYQDRPPLSRDGNYQSWKVSNVVHTELRLLLYQALVEAYLVLYLAMKWVTWSFNFENWSKIGLSAENKITSIGIETSRLPDVEKDTDIHASSTSKCRPTKAYMYQGGVIIPQRQHLRSHIPFQECKVVLKAQ